MMNKSTLIAVAMVTALAVMGLMFCWHSPDLPWWREIVGAHWHFKRQLLWNIAGVAVFAIAAMVGWKRWLMVAPFVFSGWVALWLAALLQPSAAGSWSFVRIGAISLNVWSLFPVAFALLAAWLSERGVRVKWIVLSCCAVALAAMTLRTVSDPGRVARLATFLAGGDISAATPGACARALVQRQTCEAFAHSSWFSPGDAETLLCFPGALTFSMPAASAVLFGKWFIAVAWLFFGAFALSLGCLWRGTGDVAKRSYILFLGLGVLAPAAFGCCECLGLVPMLYASVPLVSYGGVLAFAVWLGVGILVSASACRGEYVWSQADYLQE